jgi:hypothetical protein
MKTQLPSSPRLKARSHLSSHPQSFSDDDDDAFSPSDHPIIFDSDVIETSISGILSPDFLTQLQSLQTLTPFLSGYPRYVMRHLTEAHYSVLTNIVKSDSDGQPLALFFFRKFSAQPSLFHLPPSIFQVFCPLLPTLIDDDLSQDCLNIIGNLVFYSPEYLRLAMASGVIDALRSHKSEDLRTIKIKNWVFAQLLFFENPGFEREILTELAERMNTGLVTADAYALSGFVNALKWTIAPIEVASSRNVCGRAFAMLQSEHRKPIITALEFFQGVVEHNGIDLSSVALVPIVFELLDGAQEIATAAIALLENCFDNEVGSGHFFGQIELHGGLREFLVNRSFKRKMGLFGLFPRAIAGNGNAITRLVPEELAEWVMEMAQAGVDVFPFFESFITKVPESFARPFYEGVLTNECFEPTWASLAEGGSAEKLDIISSYLTAIVSSSNGFN